eukprot:572705-Pyramimonas_sp.AAC.1
MHGLTLPGNGDQPVKEPTTIRTTKKLMAAINSTRCDRCHQNAVLEGNVDGSGVKRTKVTEDY